MFVVVILTVYCIVFIDRSEQPFDLSRIATDEVLVHSWQNIWEWGVASRAYKLANAGYKVKISYGT